MSVVLDDVRAVDVSRVSGCLCCGDWQITKDAGQKKPNGNAGRCQAPALPQIHKALPVTLSPRVPSCAFFLQATSDAKPPFGAWSMVQKPKMYQAFHLKIQLLEPVTTGTTPRGSILSSTSHELTATFQPRVPF